MAGKNIKGTRFPKLGAYCMSHDAVNHSQEEYVRYNQVTLGVDYQGRTERTIKSATGKRLTDGNPNITTGAKSDSQSMGCVTY